MLQQQQANGCRENPVVDTSTRINWASIQHIRLSASETVGRSKGSRRAHSFSHFPFAPFCGANFERVPLRRPLLPPPPANTPFAPSLPQASPHHVISTVPLSGSVALSAVGPRRKEGTRRRSVAERGSDKSRGQGPR